MWWLMGARAHLAPPSLLGLGDEASAARAFDSLAILPMRIEVLRLAMSQTEISTADVMQEFGVVRNCARQHLLELADECLLVARRTTHPRGSGPITYWRADRDQIEGLLDQFIVYVLSGVR